MFPTPTILFMSCPFPSISYRIHFPLEIHQQSFFVNINCTHGAVYFSCKSVDCERATKLIPNRQKAFHFKNLGLISDPAFQLFFYLRDSWSCFSIKAKSNVCMRTELNSLNISLGHPHGCRTPTGSIQRFLSSFSKETPGKGIGSNHVKFIACRENVVASFFPLNIYIYIYIYIKTVMSAS